MTSQGNATFSTSSIGSKMGGVVGEMQVGNSLLKDLLWLKKVWSYLSPIKLLWWYEVQMIAKFHVSFVLRLHLHFSGQFLFTIC